MLVPVHGRLLDRFDHLCPGRKTVSFEGKGAERLPPQLHEIEIGRILWLQDKLPTGVLQTKPQDSGRPMAMQIIHNSVKLLALCWAPHLDVTQEVHPVMDRASKIVFGQRRPRRWTQRPTDGALTPSSIVHLLRSPGCRSWRCSGGVRAYQLLSRIPLSGDRPHLLQAHYRTRRRGGGIECFHAPLFGANSGSPRALHQVAWVRQRSPAAISNASLRLRLIASYFSSWR
jgi:hypothetical protein